MGFLILLAILVLIVGAVLVTKQEGEHGNIPGYNKKLGFSTPYGISQEENFKQPSPRYYIAIALPLLAIGSVAFIPPINVENLAIGSFFYLLAIVFIVTAIRKKSLSRTQGYLFFGLIVVLVLTIMLFSKGQDAEVLILPLVLSIGGSIYAYFSSKSK